MKIIETIKRVIPEKELKEDVDFVLVALSKREHKRIVVEGMLNADEVAFIIARILYDLLRPLPIGNVNFVLQRINLYLSKFMMEGMQE